MDFGEIERYEIDPRNKAAWLALRHRDYTASDIGALYGIGYRSVLGVWAEKTNQAPPKPDNEYMKMGRWFEPAIFNALAEKYPMIRSVQSKVYLRSPSVRAGCTPDSLAIMQEPPYDNTKIRYLPGYLNIQGKVVSKRVFQRDWCVNGENHYEGIEPPLYHQFQTNMETFFWERHLKQPVTPVLAPLWHDEHSCDVFLCPIPKRPELEASFAKVINEFWANTDAGIQPEYDEKKDADVIAKIWNRDDLGEVDLRNEPEIADLFEERQRLGAEGRAGEKRRKEIKGLIQARMGNAAYARLADGRRISMLVVRASWVEAYERQEHRQLREAKKRP